jgi:hypothetical protein
MLGSASASDVNRVRQTAHVAFCGKDDRQDDDQSARVVRARWADGSPLSARSRRRRSARIARPPAYRGGVCAVRVGLPVKAAHRSGKRRRSGGCCALLRRLHAPPPIRLGKQGCRLGRAPLRPCCAAHEKAGGGSIPSGQVAWTWWFAGCNAEVAATGNSRRNVDPSLSLDSTQMRPPMRLTSSLQM